MTTNYVSITDIQAQLNASYNSGTQIYTVFGLAVSLASFQAHVDYANLYVNSIAEQGLDVSDARYNWATMAALNLASLRILVAASGGMLTGASDYRLGDLFITKASIGKLAFERAVQGFHDALLRVLTNFSVVVLAVNASAANEVPRYCGGLINP